MADLLLRPPFIDEKLQVKGASGREIAEEMGGKRAWGKMKELLPCVCRERVSGPGSAHRLGEEGECVRCRGNSDQREQDPTHKVSQV